MAMVAPKETNGSEDARDEATRSMEPEHGDREDRQNGHNMGARARHKTGTTKRAPVGAFEPSGEPRMWATWKKVTCLGLTLCLMVNVVWLIMPMRTHEGLWRV